MIKPRSIRADASEPKGQDEAVPQVGSILGGKYVVERLLGSGGMGVVVAAQHLDLGDRVAIKLLSQRAACEKESVERFLREARAAVRLKSDNVVRVMDVGRLDNGSPFIVMEHLVGQDLGRALSTRQTFPVETAIDYLLQACVGVAEAHQFGIVHRDLKPSNLFLTAQNDGSTVVKILDFGISKVSPAEGDENLTLTKSQFMFGTPMYMSPEQIRSSKNVDARTDIWALGVILFELLSGRTPFGGESAQGILAAVVADSPHRLQSFRPDVPIGLSRVIEWCLAKDPNRRCPSVVDLAGALEPFAAPHTVETIHRIRQLEGAPGGTASSPSWSRPPVSVPPLTATHNALTVSSASKRQTQTRAAAVLLGATLSALAFGIGMKVTSFSRSAAGFTFRNESASSNGDELPTAPLGQLEQKPSTRSAPAPPTPAPSVSTPAKPPSAPSVSTPESLQRVSPRKGALKAKPVAAVTPYSAPSAPFEGAAPAAAINPLDGQK